MSRLNSFAKDVKNKVLWEKAEAIANKSGKPRAKVKKMVESKGSVAVSKTLSSKVFENYKPALSSKEEEKPVVVKAEKTRASSFFESYR
jgi:hypothetical protein